MAPDAVSGSAVLRAKKLTRPGIILVAAKHNKRELQAEIGADRSIDASRCDLNECLVGPATAAEVAALARAMVAAADLGKVRKDAVRAVEFVVSLAPATRIDERAFFVDAAQWLADRFGGSDNILSADIHRDEPRTHMHLLVLPLIGGRMVGSDAVGGPKELNQLLDDFHAEVCARYGLKRFPPRLTGAAKAAAFDAVMAELKRRHDPCVTSALWSVVRDHIEADPRPCAELLGLDIAADTKPRKLRSMTAIFTSKGKGSSRHEPDEHHKGFARPEHVRTHKGFAAPAKERTPSCEGFASSTALPEASPAPATDPAFAFEAAPPDVLPPAQPAPSAATAAPTVATVAAVAAVTAVAEPDAPPDAVRERDADFAAGTWNADTGEFLAMPAKVQSGKASARAWVAQALHALPPARAAPLLALNRASVARRLNGAYIDS